ncbi:ribosomal RNA large subunit methyltransferase E [endosymbiont of Sipalinus gigas]|nr:ribosomal RNA large subunit methyltransferase E [endosymbiont of Sipalinus gigas]
MKNNKNFSDFFYRKAKLLKLKSRSWFKIKEINNREKIFYDNIKIVDLGSSPGGWSKFASDYTSNSIIFSCDILDNGLYKKCFFFKCNILKKNSYNDFINFIKVKYINLILSDMSPNISGNKIIDSKNIYDLYKVCINLCIDKLIFNGCMVIKLFYGYYTELIIKEIKNLFNYIKILKPVSSKKKSSEFYIVAKNFKIFNK